jgi:hypothetical protein
MFVTDTNHIASLFLYIYFFNYQFLHYSVVKRIFNFSVQGSVHVLVFVSTSAKSNQTERKAYVQHMIHVCKMAN